jgi:hypothetical protein
MYLRFKIRRRKTGPAKQNYTYHVVLVESKRQSESGEPRQKIIAYLGSIRSEDFAKATTRYQFLEQTRERLNTLDFDYLTRWRLKVKLMNLFQKKATFP